MRSLPTTAIAADAARRIPDQRAWRKLVVLAAVAAVPALLLGARYRPLYPLALLAGVLARVYAGRGLQLALVAAAAALGPAAWHLSVEGRAGEAAALLHDTGIAGALEYVVQFVYGAAARRSWVLLPYVVALGLLLGELLRRLGAGTTRAVALSSVTLVCGAGAVPAMAGPLREARAALERARTAAAAEHAFLERVASGVDGLDRSPLVAGRDVSVVLFVGEAATRWNWSLYGYPRATSAPLADHAASGRLVALTAAVASRPHGAGLSSLAFLYRRERDAVVPLVHTLARAGVETTWLSGAAKPWTYHYALTGPRRLVVGDGGRSDEAALVATLRKVLRGPDASRLIVLDSYAGHFPYCGNIPADRVVNWDDWMARLSGPAIWGRHHGNRAALDCYDSAMRHVAGAVRDAMRAIDESARPAVLVFAPGRGEDVWRQAGRYAGAPSVRDVEIPLLVYANRPFAERYPELLARARAHAARPYESAWLHDAILGLMGVADASGAPAFDPRLSLFDERFDPPAPAVRPAAERDYVETARAERAAHPRGDRFCVHRANSLFKYLEAAAAHGCVEIDVAFDGAAGGAAGGARRAFVFHPPEAANAGLELGELIRRAGVPPLGLWLDVKRLAEPDVAPLLARLAEVVPPEARARVLVETDNLALARSPAARALADSGFVLSYYLPTDLGRRCGRTFDADCEGAAARLAAALSGSAFGGVSFDARGLALARAVRDRTTPTPVLNAWTPSRHWSLGPERLPLLDEVRMFLVEMAGPFWY